MSIKKAFVYTEIQISNPFDQLPWREINSILKNQPGLVRKTWLSGFQNNSVGGFYEFDGIENARNFALNYFPEECKQIGATATIRIFNGDITEEASRDLKSPHYSAFSSTKDPACDK